MGTASNELFANIATTPIPQFYRENGEPDYKEVVSVFLGLSNTEIARLGDVSVKSVRFDSDRIPPILKQRIREIINICELAAEMLGGDLDKTQLWFTTKNQMLGNVSPRDMIRFGRYKKLLDILVSIKSGDVP